MAYLPCSVGPHKHRGRNTNLYIALAIQGETSRRRGRVCAEHWSEIELWLSQFEVDPDSGAYGDPATKRLCPTCLKPIEEGRTQLFVTSYPANNERKDYWGHVHEHCLLPYSLQAASSAE